MMVKILYTCPMFISLSLSALLSGGAVGFLLSILLFGICFLGTHLFKLAKYGWEKVQEPPNKQTPPQKPQEKAPAKEQEPIYYVIERKRKKPKTTYSEPKQITFKKD